MINPTRANQNGNVIIVSSGSFAETVVITAANGNVTLMAAPGIEANIDAIVQGVPGGAARQNAPGIIVNAPADRFVVIRNIQSRNWAIGIQIQGESRVSIESSRVDNNVNWGILAQDNARVTLSKTEVFATGRRVGAGTDFPVTSTPMPGTGIQFVGGAAGVVSFTSVAGSVGGGVVGSPGQVCISHVTVFDNNPNLSQVSRSEDCSGNQGGNK